MEKSLEGQMLEAICQSHWQSNASDSKVAAKQCALIALSFAKGYFLNVGGSTIGGFIEMIDEEIEKLKSDAI